MGRWGALVGRLGYNCALCVRGTRKLKSSRAHPRGRRATVLIPIRALARGRKTVVKSEMSCHGAKWQRTEKRLIFASFCVFHDGTLPLRCCGCDGTSHLSRATPRGSSHRVVVVRGAHISAHSAHRFITVAGEFTRRLPPSVHRRQGRPKPRAVMLLGQCYIVLGGGIGGL